MTETLKFENANSLSHDELTELQNFKESDLDRLKEEQLKDLRKALLAEKDGYLKRSTNEKSKKWISSLIDRVVTAIDKKLSQHTDASSDSQTEQRNTMEVAEQAKIKELEEKYNIHIKKEWVMYVVEDAKDASLNGAYENLKSIESAFRRDVSKDSTVTKVYEVAHDAVWTHQDKTVDNSNNKSSQKKEVSEIVQTEEIFEQRLEHLLDPKTTLIFTIGEKALVMKFDNSSDKQKAEKLFLSLEKDYQDDKMAAYAVLAFLDKYKDKVKSPKDIYMEAAKGLNWNQIVIAKDFSTDFALLDVASKGNISTINVDTGNKFLNAVFRTLFLPIDTASVEKWKLTNYLYGTKANSTWLWNRTKESKDDVYAFFDQPLKRFSKEKVMERLAQQVEDILTDDDKLEKLFDKKHLSIAEQIALDYLKDHGITKKQLAAIDIKEKFKSDDAIKHWMETHKILDKFTSDKVAVEISKDGFVKVNPNAFDNKTQFVKIKLDKVRIWDKVEDKEALMEVNKVSYKDLFGEQPEEFKNRLATLPPIILKDGGIIGFTKDGLYVIGEKVGKGVDAVQDYLREHKEAAIAVSAAIVSSLLTLAATDNLHISINMEWIGHFFKSIGHGFEHIWKLLEKPVRNLWDLIKDFNPTKLEAFGLGYLVTALPLNYQIEVWKEKYAQLYGNVKGAPSIDAELDIATNKSIDLPSDEEIKKYTEAKNKFAHVVLTQVGIFKPSEATDVDYDVDVKDNGEYSIFIRGKGEQAGSIVSIEDQTLYVDAGNVLMFDVRKWKDWKFILNSVNWRINVDVFGKDDYIKFDGTKATYVETHAIWSDEELKTIDIEWKSFDEIYRELTSTKSEKDNKKCNKQSDINSHKKAA